MKRMILDGLLFVLLILLMGFAVLPKPLHEALGIGMGICALAHLLWNRKWFSSLGRGKWSARRAVAVFVNAALLISCLVALVSGLAIANQLFPGVFGLAWQRSILAHQAHVASSYWLLIFSGLHLGLHWEGLWIRVVRRCGWDSSSWRYRFGTQVAAMAIFLLGIAGSFLHRIGDRLMMKHIFGTAATSLPPAVFLLVLVGIFGLYTVIGHMAGKKE